MRATKQMVAVASFVLVACGCGGSGAKPADGGAATSGGTGGSGSGASGSSASSGSSSGTGGSKSNGTGGSSSGTGGSSSSGTGGSSSSGTGGSSSSGTGGSSSSGTGGSAAGGAGSTGSTTLPSDGNQLSVCTMAQGDCNKTFACYGGSTPFSAGRGYCSKICTMDTDCDGLAPSGTKYTCSAGGGGGTRMCEVVCTAADDTTSCPPQMTCQQTAAATGGTMASFRCKYPLEKSGAWGPCNDGTHECDAMLTCAGTTSSMSRTGYCTATCAMDADCPKPSSGSVTPTCVTVAPARGMMMATKLCGLDCSMAMDGCPDGEACTMVGTTTGMGGMGAVPTRRCEYK